MEAFAEMIFVHGFVHGDPHPGNILVSPEGRDDFVLVLLDHGLYKDLDEKFRLKYCELWKALILLDTEKIQDIGETFGVGRYAKYFPVIFTGRTVGSKSALGTQMSEEEKMHLKHELRSLRMDDVSSFMESLPSDFLSILRTDGLLRSISGKLGAPRHIRLLTYAKYAVYGLATKTDLQSGYKYKGMVSEFGARMSYLQLWTLVEFYAIISQIRDIKKSFARKVKRMLREAGYFLYSTLFFLQM